MGRAVAYSDVDVFFQSVDGAKGCLIDTNFLISLTEENHKFHDDSVFIYEKLAEYEIAAHTTVSARTEFVDYQRRMKMTETLMDMLSPASRWRTSEAIKKVLRAHRGWIDNQAAKDDLPVLSDSRLKEIKQAFLPKTQSGQVGWIELCKEHLSGQLWNMWREVEDSLGINYVELRAEESKQFLETDLNWKNMFTLAEETCLGSNDAMILNVLNSSAFPFVVSADYDLAYGVMKTGSKAILVPDSLYNRHLKKIRF